MDHKQVKEMDAKMKNKRKEYADRHRRAQEPSVTNGDWVVVKQQKTTTKPPWDPVLYKVKEVRDTKVVLIRNGKEKIRNVEKIKKLQSRMIKALLDKKHSNGEEDDDDLDLDVSKVFQGQDLDRDSGVLEDIPIELAQAAQGDINIRRSDRLRKAPVRLAQEYVEEVRVQKNKRSLQNRSPQQRKKVRMAAKYGRPVALRIRRDKDGHYESSLINSEESD